MIRFTSLTPFAFCLGAMLAFGVVQSGCHLGDDFALGDSCEARQPRPGEVCRGGVWVSADLDATLDMESTRDQAPGQDGTGRDSSGDDMARLDSSSCVPKSAQALCEEADVWCGPLPAAEDGCGAQVEVAECGPCGNAEGCNAGVCVPECDGQTSLVLCEAAGAGCGDLDTMDSCGNQRNVRCGGCQENEACEQNVCVCVPRTEAQLCDALGAECGLQSVDDGCGAQVEIQCGDCSEFAGEFTCSNTFECSCQAESEESFCGRFAAQCGSVQGENNCGETLTVDCGGCENNDPCNADKTCPICQPLSDEALCSRQGLQCGDHQVTNNCNDMVSITCPGCDNGFVCSASGACECPEPSCQSVECGVASNACGNTKSCPNTCNATTQQCVGNNCQCKPQSDQELCADATATCGSITVTDRCNATRTVSCGSCNNGQVCTASNDCCTPKSNAQLCSEAGRVCGSLTVTDNCGVQRTISSCGSCDPGENCNNAGACVCPQPSCSGVACGSVTNACGNTASCPNTCNATTQQCVGNSCLCKPETDQQLCANTECGTISPQDRCNMTRVLTCPNSCSSGEVCSSNSCVCPQPSCSGIPCGSVSNACGNTKSCTNTCNATTQQCVNNVCSCKPQSAQEVCAGAECGSVTVTNRCTGDPLTFNCGGCAGGESCLNNQCVCPQPSCNVGICGTVTNSCGNSRLCKCPAGMVCLGATPGGGAGFCEFDCGNGIPC